MSGYVNIIFDDTWNICWCTIYELRNNKYSTMQHINEAKWNCESVFRVDLNLLIHLYGCSHFFVCENFGSKKKKSWQHNSSQSQSRITWDRIEFSCNIWWSLSLQTTLRRLNEQTHCNSHSPFLCHWRKLQKSYTHTKWIEIVSCSQVIINYIWLFIFLNTKLQFRFLSTTLLSFWRTMSRRTSYETILKLDFSSFEELKLCWLVNKQNSQEENIAKNRIQFVAD